MMKIKQTKDPHRTTESDIPNSKSKPNTTNNLKTKLSSKNTPKANLQETIQCPPIHLSTELLSRIR